MAFEVGERVTSRWTGPGTVTGLLERDQDNVAMQRVRFDNQLLMERPWAIGKLQTLDEVEPVRRSDGEKA